MIKNRTKRIRKKQETGNNVSSNFFHKTSVVNPLNTATSSFQQLSVAKVILYAGNFNSGSWNTPGGRNEGC
jgi:hypothetical protein